MRLTVKNYKRVEWASEETDCYQATLYLDGQRIGTAENDGHGGADLLSFNSPEDRQAFEAYVAEWAEGVKDDPRFQIDGVSYADEETLVSEACAIYRRERDMKRALKGYESVVRIERTEGYLTKIMTAALPQSDDPEAVIAEEIEDGDEAFIYRADTGVIRHR
jgi:hypothetical protein